MSLKLTFYGAARTVTGSKFVIKTRRSSVLTEYGLFQGHRKKALEMNSRIPEDALSADAMVLSHAHIDHSGNIPRLVAAGFNKRIFTTPATIDLANIMLLDSAEIQERDAEYANKKLEEKGEPLIEPLYSIEEAQAAGRSFEPLDYHETREIAPGVKATLYDAGHILGSAQVLYEIKGRRILFTGDLGQPQLPVVRDPERVPEPDIIISESTYGDRTHTPVAEAKERLQGLLQDAYERKAKIVVPAFSVGRTQALVLVMHELMTEGRLPDMPIWVDSPLSLEATQVFRKHPECYDKETWEYLKQDKDPFGFFRLRYVKKVEESKALNHINGPCVIIASSGMCEGGRVVHHLKKTIPDPKNLVIITGFQAPGTLGRRIVEGVESIRLYGEEFPLNCEVEVLNEYSAHADRTDLINMFKGYDPKNVKQVFLVHGDERQTLALGKAVAELGYEHVEIPEVDQEFELR
ncbi:MBL fold metallo-hydrolase [candidate division WOR-3 bacterium]|uniref:MBL fold metallo-hydrolase n=1 Tax=candidate division WOR-3 bacterium TaxID=2052148 RepID=A0A9D5KCG3_UNCW3|nr:MBL fold metallo-hydrolase [candidate division WOR-3 bacterium]MBD3365659.1 MBL fold metallo-hydrolase [candidate division WOR-3 bacterium]